jgi:hypothetical protein
MKETITRIIILLIVLAAGPASAATPEAGDFNMIVSGWSKHYNTGLKLNEKQSAIGMEYTVHVFGETGQWRSLITTTAFIDSFGTDGWYGGMGLMRRMAQHGAVALELGLYPVIMQHSHVNNGKLTIVPAPVATLTIGRVAINATVMVGTVVTEEGPDRRLYTLFTELKVGF